MAQSFVKMKIKTNSKKNKKNVKDGVKNKFTNAPRENDTTDLMSPVSSSFCESNIFIFR